MRKLTPKQEKFVAEYAIDNNATQAAIRAGYSKKGANRAASHLLSNIVIQKAIERRRAKLVRKIDVKAENVIQELARIAFSDVRHLFDEDGQLIPIAELKDEVASAVASIEISKRQAGGNTELVSKIKLADKLKALEMLSRHLGLFEKDHDQAGDGFAKVVLFWPDNGRNPQLKNPIVDLKRLDGLNGNGKH